MRQLIRRPLFLAGAGLLLLAAMAFVSLRVVGQWEAPEREEAETTGVRMGGLVVAQQDLLPRTVLTKKHLTSKRIPREAIPENAIRRPDRLYGYVMKRRVRAGWPVTFADTAGHVSRYGMAARIPAGHRAMIIPIAPEPTLHHMLRRGDRLDVQASFGQEYATTVLSDLEILAIDQGTGNDDQEEPSPEAGGERPQRSEARQAQRSQGGVSQTLTVAVTPKEAEKLAFLQGYSNATVHYVLRAEEGTVMTVSAG